MIRNTVFWGVLIGMLALIYIKLSGWPALFAVFATISLPAMAKYRATFGPGPGSEEEEDEVIRMFNGVSALLWRFEDEDEESVDAFFQKLRSPLIKDVEDWETALKEFEDKHPSGGGDAYERSKLEAGVQLSLRALEEARETIRNFRQY